MENIQTLNHSAGRHSMNLSDIYYHLVVAAQAEYDARIARGIHPYSMASYHFSDAIAKELDKHVDSSGWKAENWKALIAAQPKIEGNENGRWAVSAVVGSWKAYATPGFFEAYANSIQSNN